MFYYDIHVSLEKNYGYSVGVKSETELSDDEAINLARIEKKFEEEWDADEVDYVEEISEEQFNEWYN